MSRRVSVLHVSTLFCRCVIGAIGEVLLRVLLYVFLRVLLRMLSYMLLRVLLHVLLYMLLCVLLRMLSRMLLRVLLHERRHGVVVEIVELTAGNYANNITSNVHSPKLHSWHNSCTQMLLQTRVGAFAPAQLQFIDDFVMSVQVEEKQIRFLGVHAGATHALNASDIVTEMWHIRRLIFLLSRGCFRRVLIVFAWFRRCLCLLLRERLQTLLVETSCGTVLCWTVLWR